jgi:hypothetical protein
LTSSPFAVGNEIALGIEHRGGVVGHIVDERMAGADKRRTLVRFKFDAEGSRVVRIRMGEIKARRRANGFDQSQQTAWTLV